MDGCFVGETHANLTFPKRSFPFFSCKPRNMLIQLSAGHFQKAVFFGHRYIPLKFSDIYINHVQEEFTSASQIKQFLVAKPPEILPVCAPVFPAQPERPRTEFGGNETSCYQSPKQPKMTCVPSANLIYNIIYIYIYIDPLIN